MKIKLWPRYFVEAIYEAMPKFGAWPNLRPKVRLGQLEASPGFRVYRMGKCRVIVYFLTAVSLVVSLSYFCLEFRLGE